ncbi:MAG: hypothetical protein IJ148_08090 [Bacteroidaceae bacterium]|nr:hypothetical protein [Bacteroidaceae bacterium]
MKTKITICLCALLLTCSLVTHAQYVKVTRKDSQNIIYDPVEMSKVDSINVEKQDGIYVYRFYRTAPWNSEDQLIESYGVDDIERIRFIDPETMYSIIANLKDYGNYTYFLRLIDDVDAYYKGETPLSLWLGGLGDFNVYVADDSAWERFFQQNAKLPAQDTWHNATSYDKLSVAQKHLLLHGSIVSSAFRENNIGGEWHDVYSYDPYTGEQTDATIFYVGDVRKMRFDTAIENTDSICYLPSEQLPYSYNQQEKDYWERFRSENGGRGIFLQPDTSRNMLVALTDQFCFGGFHYNYALLEDDISIITGRQRTKREESPVNGSVATGPGRIVDNGFIHEVDLPLRPLESMAEVIRTNGNTNIFSHILDRFCAPYYCHELTEQYRVKHPEFTDSIFVKRYFAKENNLKDNTTTYVDLYGVPYEPGPNGINSGKTYYPYKAGATDRIPSLKFDPGWNGYFERYKASRYNYPKLKDKSEDMAAIFVPSDEAMWHYFQNAGEEIIRTYYAHEGTKDEIPYTRATTLEELYRQIDCIPVGTLDLFINNLMQTSFVNSVPSKWNRLTDDTGTQFFEDVVEAWNQLDTCLMANNGVVYVMNHVIVPPDYYSVTGPAVISQTNKIIKSALYDDWGYNSGKSGRNYYSTYLKNTRNRYTFLLPSDSALNYYYDPVSMKCRIPNVVEYYLAEGSFPAKLRRRNYYCPYNQRYGNVGTIGNVIPGISGYTNEEAANRMMDIVENHIIVQDGTNPMTRWEQIRNGIDPDSPLNEYYLSNRGNAVKVIRDEDDNIIAVKGGFQLENERLGIVGEDPGISSCQVKKSYEEVGNGNTLVLDAPLVPTYRSVYSIFTNDADQLAAGKGGFGGETPYSAFYNLCNANDYETEIIGCGLATEKSEAQKYMVFIEHNGLDYNVQFFNSCQDHNPNSFSSNHYTIFVPTNEAIQEAVKAGLPTWEGIREDYRSHCKPQTNELATTEDSIRIAAKITYLTNFVRYHFVEKSVFADKCELAPNEFVSFCFDKDSEEMCKLHVARIGSSDGTRLCVCDDMTWQKNAGSMGSNPFETVGERNVLARDISCSKSPVDVVPKGITIEASSAAVIHSIPGCLNHVELIGGRYDKIWETTERAREYLRKYPIQ